MSFGGLGGGGRGGSTVREYGGARLYVVFVGYIYGGGVKVCMIKDEMMCQISGNFDTLR